MRDEVPGYSTPTGDAWRWPDVLDRWRYWAPLSSPNSVILGETHTTRCVTALRLLCDLIDLRATDLCATLVRVIDPDRVRRRSIEDDWLIANTIDAVIAEQERRDGVLDTRYFERTAQRRAVPLSTARYVGDVERADHTDADEAWRLAWNGVMKRPVY